MSEFVVSWDSNHKPTYDLFAVCNHFGQLQAGHYTAIAQNQGDWFCFNDHKVRAMTPQEPVITNAAYTLFYKRCGIDFESLDYEKIKNTIESLASNKSSDAPQQVTESLPI